MNNTISIIGAGSWGTALSILLANNGKKVNLWSLFQEEIDMLNNEREHIQKLPGIKIPSQITCTADLEKALSGSKTVVLVVPSQTIRQTAKNINNHIDKNSIVVCCSKGLEEGSCKRLDEVIKEEIPSAKRVVLSGPSHAEEVAKNIPSALVAASEDIAAAEFIQEIFMSPYFRVYTNTDVIGVELGGALKNVIALCAGIVDGLGLGDNTNAALMTRGIAEITRLGVSLGAKRNTFAGLTGIGDLIVTCTSIHSRNRRAGILIGQGKSTEEAIKEVKMVVEGITTTKAAYDLANRKNVIMPITSEAYDVLYNGKNAKEAVLSLMMRDKKLEIEELNGETWL